MGEGKGATVPFFSLFCHPEPEGEQSTTRFPRHPERASFVILNSFQDLTFEGRWN